MPRASKTDAEIASMTAEYIHKLLKQGGVKVQDAEGNVVLIDFTAAMINAINNYLKRTNVSAMPAVGSTAGDLAKEAERRGLTHTGSGKKYKKKTPPLSEDDDAATA